MMIWYVRNRVSVQEKSEDQDGTDIEHLMPKIYKCVL